METIHNAATSAQRDKLERLTQEFSAIVTHGKVVYLGTPQTKDSIYNRLPSKGFKVCVFTARYPTLEQQAKYGDMLASYIVEDLERVGDTLRTGGGIDGTMGLPVDPKRYTEEDLIEKEIEWGSEGFALQYMLDTELSDAVRQQLKLSDLIVANFGRDRVPEKIDWGLIQQNQVRLPDGFGSPESKLYYGVIPNCDWTDACKERVYCYIDPAGGGEDELAWSIGFSQAPYIHWVYTGGLRGGLTEANTRTILNTFIEFGVTRVLVETNMGHGLFEINLRKSLADEIKRLKQESDRVYHDNPVLSKELARNVEILSKIGIESEYSTDQKERRIIDSLVSTMQRHQLVVHQSAIESDTKYNRAYGASDRQYSVFHQMEFITTDRGSLRHDDRLESLAGLVRMFKYDLLVDEDKAAEKRDAKRAAEFYNNPLGYSEDILSQIGSRRNSKPRPYQRRRRKGRFIIH